MRRALLLVDLQNSFLQDVRDAKVVGKARHLAAAARADGVPVIHVWTTVSGDKDDRMPHWRRIGRHGCVEGSHDHASPVECLPGDHVVPKRFFSAFAGTGLEELLGKLGVERICIAGMYLHACVQTTAIDAYQRGFSIEIAEDAVGGNDRLHAAISRNYLSGRVAEFLPRDEESSHAPAAVAAAKDAFRTWRRKPWDQRVSILRETVERIEVPALAERIARAVGKPENLAMAEAKFAVQLIRAAVRREKPVERRCGAHSRVRLCPRGVVAVVTPWNNPAAIALGKIAPALLHGNTVVWKPSPLDGGVAEYLAGLVPWGDTVQIVHGGPAVARQVMADANVDAVCMTGSDHAGFSAQAICSTRRIALRAELGGNNAAILWDEDDVTAAVLAVAEGAFSFAGQRCTANRRMIVPRARVPLVLEILEKHLPAVPSLISQESRARVGALLERCGCVVLQGVEGPGDHVIPATVAVADDAGSEIVQEETFGPVLVVQAADDFDHALALCNGVRQGLAAALFSRDPALCSRFLDDAEAGILKLNFSTVGIDAEAPIGGWKSSGIGPPEHGPGDREFFTRMQAVYE